MSLFDAINSPTMIGKRNIVHHDASKWRINGASLRRFVPGTSGPRSSLTAKPCRPSAEGVMETPHGSFLGMICPPSKEAVYLPSRKYA